MTTSLLNAAATAIVASLSSATPVCASITRVKLSPVSQATPLALVVRPLRADPLERNLSGVPISWAVHVECEAYARASGATSPDQAVDPLVLAVYQRLTLDPTLGGACVGLKPEAVTYDFDADGDKTVCATLNFIVYQFDPTTTFSQE